MYSKLIYLKHINIKIIIYMDYTIYVHDINTISFILDQKDGKLL